MPCADIAQTPASDAMKGRGWNAGTGRERIRAEREGGEEGELGCGHELSDAVDAKRSPVAAEHDRDDTLLLRAELHLKVYQKVLGGWQRWREGRRRSFG